MQHCVSVLWSAPTDTLTTTSCNMSKKIHLNKCFNSSCFPKRGFFPCGTWSVWNNIKLIMFVTEKLKCETESSRFNAELEKYRSRFFSFRSSLSLFWRRGRGHSREACRTLMDSLGIKAWSCLLHGATRESGWRTLKTWSQPKVVRLSRFKQHAIPFDSSVWWWKRGFDSLCLKAF